LVLCYDCNSAIFQSYSHFFIDKGTRRFILRCPWNENRSHFELRTAKIIGEFDKGLLVLLDCFGYNQAGFVAQMRGNSYV